MCSHHPDAIVLLWHESELIFVQLLWPKCRCRGLSGAVSMMKSSGKLVADPCQDVKQLEKALTSIMQKRGTRDLSEILEEPKHHYFAAFDMYLCTLACSMHLVVPHLHAWFYLRRLARAPLGRLHPGLTSWLSTTISARPSSARRSQ